MQLSGTGGGMSSGYDGNYNNNNYRNYGPNYNNNDQRISNQKNSSNFNREGTVKRNSPKYSTLNPCYSNPNPWSKRVHLYFNFSSDSTFFNKVFFNSIKIRREQAVFIV